MRRAYNVPDLDLDRFRMNGKALCLMRPEMFVYRVPSKGLTLYEDFQARFRNFVLGLAFATENRTFGRG